MKAKKDIKKDAKNSVTKTRSHYTPEFRKQALQRAEKDGIAAVARDLGLQESQRHTWRSKQRLEGLTTEEQKLQHAEFARLKRDLPRLVVVIYPGVTLEMKSSSVSHPNAL